MPTVCVISGAGSVWVWAATGGRVGRRALSPLPSTLRALSGLFTIQNLICQLNIAFRALGTRIVSQNRFPEAWRLGQANTPRDDGSEDLIFEELAQIGGYLPG